MDRDRENMNQEKDSNINISIPRKGAYLIAAALILVGIGAGAFLGMLDQPVAAFQELFQQEDREVVATVNDEVITREEMEVLLEQQKQQYQMQGMDLDSEEMSDMMEQLKIQVLDSMIANLLMAQAAEDKGIAVSDEDLQKEYQELAQQFGGEEELKAQLEAAGITEEELKDDIARNLPAQMYMESYMEENISPEDLEVSEEEVKALYDQYKSQIGDEFGEFEEVKPQLKQDLMQQKESEIFHNHVEQLREEGDVEIYL